MYEDEPALGAAAGYSLQTCPTSFSESGVEEPPLPPRNLK